MNSVPPTPIHIHIPPSLQQYTTPLTRYLTAHPQYTNLVVSAFIFDAPAQISTPDKERPTRLLILHRAAHERSFGNRWEVPGGSSDVTDPTILHSLAREVFEETGLILTRFIRQVGNMVEFQTGKGERRRNWAKLNFEIEVAEIDGIVDQAAEVNDDGFMGKGAGSQDEGHKSTDRSEAAAPDATVTIDPQEHQGYAWATADDIASGKYMIATPEQRDLILGAFRARRDDGGKS